MVDFLMIVSSIASVTAYMIRSKSVLNSVKSIQNNPYEIVHFYSALDWANWEDASIAVVCDVNPGINPFPLLARPWNRRWPDFLTFTACKKSRLGLEKGKKAHCVSNRCKELFKRKKYFGVRCTLTLMLFSCFYLSVSL